MLFEETKKYPKLHKRVLKYWTAGTTEGVGTDEGFDWYETKEGVDFWCSLYLYGVPYVIEQYPQHAHLFEGATTLLNQHKVVLLNGPLKCGKDVAAEYISEHLRAYNPTKAECKEWLHTLTQALFCISEEEYWDIYDNRETKELPMERFTVTNEAARDLWHVLGSEPLLKRICDVPNKGDVQLSIREAIIYTSEIVAKPLYGENIFGVKRAHKVGSYDDPRLFIDASSAAFVVEGEVKADEVGPLIDLVGQENILLLRIHSEERGCTFEGDSRRYIPDGVLDNTIDVYNNDTLDSYLEEVLNHVKSFIQEDEGLVE